MRKDSAVQLTKHLFYHFKQAITYHFKTSIETVNQAHLACKKHLEFCNQICDEIRDREASTNSMNLKTPLILMLQT